MQAQTGLAVQENYHEFCRMQTRLKSNFQLNEYVMCKNYSTWIELLAKFSIESFKSWQITNASMFYLLNLWMRLIASTPYLKPDVSSQLDMYAPDIAKQYIASRLECAQAVVKEEFDESKCAIVLPLLVSVFLSLLIIIDPLENDQALEEQLDSLPQLVHSNYEAVGQHLLSIFDPLFNTYRQAFSVRNELNMKICEGQLSWIVYIFGAVAGKKFVSSSAAENEVMDANFTARVLQCITLMSERLQVDQSAVQDEYVQRFECAILYFLRSFKRMYIGDTMVSHPRVRRGIMLPLRFEHPITSINFTFPII